MSLNGLSCIHLELTSRCNKACWMCGRRKMEKEYPEKCDWGDMPYEMVKDIARQVPSGIVIQFHNNGEPLLYSRLSDTLHLFDGNIRSFNTNGKLLMEKADEIIGNLETLVISVIQNDPEGDEQYEIVKKFLDKKGSKNPDMVYRLLGKIDNEERWQALPGIVARRILHSPMGSFNYKKTPTVPEIGICLDLLTHLAIDRYGYVSFCVRYDPDGLGRIGHIAKETLDQIWNGELRQMVIQKHLTEPRSKDWKIHGKVMLCQSCDYWGIPRGD